MYTEHRCVYWCVYWCVLMCHDVCTDVCTGVCKWIVFVCDEHVVNQAHTFALTSTDVHWCAYSFVVVCADVCTDVCTDVCNDAYWCLLMCTDVCADVCAGVYRRIVFGAWWKCCKSSQLICTDLYWCILMCVPLLLICTDVRADVRTDVCTDDVFCVAYWCVPMNISVPNEHDVNQAYRFTLMSSDVYWCVY